MNKTANIIEGILFLAGVAVDKEELKAKLDLSGIEVEEAVAEIKAKYENSGVVLNEFNGKLQFSTNPDFADEIAAVLNPLREKEFSKSLLEVAAIVAYKQPVTRLEIEDIRGVSAEYALSALLKQDVVEVVGRKEVVGRPLLYGTTDVFLKKFNLKSLKDLPDYEEMLETLSNLSGGEANDALFNHPEGEELPDFLKDEEVVSV